MFFIQLCVMASNNNNPLEHTIEYLNEVHPRDATDGDAIDGDAIEVTFECLRKIVSNDKTFAFPAMSKVVEGVFDVLNILGDTLDAFEPTLAIRTRRQYAMLARALWNRPLLEYFFLAEDTDDIDYAIRQRYALLLRCTYYTTRRSGHLGLWTIDDTRNIMTRVLTDFGTRVDEDSDVKILWEEACAAASSPKGDRHILSPAPRFADCPSDVDAACPRPSTRKRSARPKSSNGAAGPSGGKGVAAVAMEEDLPTLSNINVTSVKSLEAMWMRVIINGDLEESSRDASIVEMLDIIKRVTKTG